MDKVILITGATEGIGKAAALELASTGARLILVGRNATKTQRVLEELKAASGNPKLETIVGDLSTIAGTRAVAAEFRKRSQRLDVLINNAGAIFSERKLTSDGIEQTFALNHLSYFLLTRELLPLLEATPGSRIVSTASGAHSRGHLTDLEDAVKREKGYFGLTVYSDSKLANILFTRELGKRLAAKGVVASCFHPGYVRSGFGHNNKGIVPLFISLTTPFFGRSPEKGAETLVWLATSPEAGQGNGKYFFNCRVKRPTRRAQDDELASRLWALSEKLCGTG